MPPKAQTIARYLAALPEDRRQAVEAIRKVVNRNIHKRFAEGMQYGMPAWFLPHSEYPHGYHCDPRQPLPFASVASQKGHIGIYLFCVYCSEDEKARFIEEWKATGKRLDLGAGCVRVKSLEDVPLAVLGRAIKRATARRFIASYEAALPASVKARRARTSGPESTPVARKAAGKKARKKK